MKNQKRNAKKNNFGFTFCVPSFFRAYLQAVKTKAICFTYPLVESLTTRTFLRCLEKETRIAGYHFVKEKKNVVIFLNYEFSVRQSLDVQINFYSSKGRKRIVSAKLLQQFAQRNPLTFALIRTNVGFMTLKDCLQHHCGGEFLLTIV